MSFRTHGAAGNSGDMSPACETTLACKPVCTLQEGTGFAVQIPLDAAEKWGGKSDKEAQMFEPQASFCASRLDDPFFGNSEGAASWGRLSLLTFFGEAKKVSGPPGPVPACSYGVTNH